MKTWTQEEISSLLDKNNAAVLRGLVVVTENIKRDNRRFGISLLSQLDKGLTNCQVNAGRDMLKRFYLEALTVAANENEKAKADEEADMAAECAAEREAEMAYERYLENRAEMAYQQMGYNDIDW